MDKVVKLIVQAQTSGQDIQIQNETNGSADMHAFAIYVLEEV